jgi:acyl-CoA thioester hydrolase
MKTIQQPYKFFTSIRVRFNETDLQGHVNFGQYYFYFDVGVTDYLKVIGYSYQQMHDDHIDMLYLESQARYISSSYFDETLNIHTRIGHIGNSSMHFEFQAIAANDGRAVAEGHIAIVMIQYGTRQKIRIPDRIRDAVEKYENA